MAKYVFTVVEIALSDDREVRLRPLPIARLRRFMEAWELFGEAETEEQATNAFINCCGIALEDSFKGEFDTLKPTAAKAKEGEFLSKPYKDYLEEVLDLPTIYEIMDVCGGIKLNDPNLQAAVAEELGKTST